ncbi:hypothetical protein O181_066229 [Austropuccinia psidii MF-1]|uniref:Uncharacterized protein n=1 Tax=Austropuccinia psidii MF-1 TaxID=1389203 RepID=A0A9Q3ESM0_9BASI|nr:hypothetical protein [Austropuccinia psidii MF-1]
MPEKLCQCPQCINNTITCPDGTKILSKYLSECNKRKHQVAFRNAGQESSTTISSDSKAPNQRSSSNISNKMDETAPTLRKPPSFDDSVTEPANAISANMTTISHLPMPLVDDLLNFKDPVEIRTFQRPNGCMI